MYEYNRKDSCSYLKRLRGRVSWSYPYLATNITVSSCWPCWPAGFRVEKLADHLHSSDAKPLLLGSFTQRHSRYFLMIYACDGT
eukprot:scaffold425142_cov47-Prasinocladus_malaysianus.AAC.1